MGSDGRFPYPKEVWSPGGGWWPLPKAWRANTAAAFGILIVAVIPVFMISEKKMERFGTPTNRIPWRPGLKTIDDEE